MPEILNDRLKTGDQFTAISDLQNNGERVLLRSKDNPAFL